MGLCLALECLLMNSISVLCRTKTTKCLSGTTWVWATETEHLYNYLSNRGNLLNLLSNIGVVHAVIS